MASSDTRTRVLLVAHEAGTLREAVSRSLDDRFILEAVVDVDAATPILKRGDVGVVMFELGAGDTAQWGAFSQLQAQSPDVPIVMMCERESEDVSARALRDGAQDIIPHTAIGPGLARTLRFAIERHRIVRERQAALERLRELERFKTQFINTAAHELNSPLTPVKLQLHLLRTEHVEGLSGKQKASLDIVERNVDRLIALVGDVLEAARLQANRLVVRKEPLDLYDVVREAVDSTQSEARKYGVSLSVTGKPGLRVEADPGRMSQVVYNLLGNALKFTPQGGQVKVTTVREGEFAVVRVTDTGIGLRPEDFLKLFQPFSQTHEWSSGKRTGSGLGLYISQGIVEQHSGRIWCDSPGPNRGSTFSFAIPVAKAQPAPKPSVAVAEKKPRSYGFWPILFFKCPTCASRDINMRILRNKYECRACLYEWQ